MAEERIEEPFKVKVEKKTRVNDESALEVFIEWSDGERTLMYKSAPRLEEEEAEKLALRAIMGLLMFGFTPVLVVDENLYDRIADLARLFSSALNK
ncbi:MAG: hypothetical protein QW517_10505 [Thermofilaceae archaeon]